MIEPSEDSFETMMERKNPSSKQMESSEGSSNTTVETAGSRAEAAEAAAAAAGLAGGLAQEVEELPIDLLQDMEEPSSGPHREIKDPPNDLLQDLEESRDGSRLEAGGPFGGAPGRMEEVSVNPRGAQEEQDDYTDLAGRKEEEHPEGPTDSSTAGIMGTVRSIISLYFRMQDLREQQRVAEEILMKGISAGHLPIPGKFSGDRREYHEFVALCQLILQSYPRMLYSDRLRVGYVICHLSGLALEWAKDLVERESPLIDDFPAFLEAMSDTFQYRQALRVAEEAMFNLRQGDRAAIEYVNEFQGLVPTLGWPDEVLRAHLCQGLKEEIRHYLFRVPQPDSLDSLIVLVLQIEEKLAERRAMLRLPPEARPRNLTWIDSPAPERWAVSSWLPCEAQPAISRDHLFLLLMVRVNPYHSVAVRALVDSGAGGNFMDERFAQEHYVELYEKPYPRSVQSVDGSLVGHEPVWLYTEPLVCTHQNHQESLEFDIVPSPDFSVILGTNWLRVHSPEVDWVKGRCTFHSPYCLKNCFRPPPPCIALERHARSLLPGLPPLYSDLADVFNPKEADEETSNQPSSDGSDDLSESEPSELQQAGDSDPSETYYERPSTAPWEPVGARMQERARREEYWHPQDTLTSRHDYVQMIPELFDQLHGATWFTKLGLRGTVVEESMNVRQTEDVWKAAFGLELQEMTSYQPFLICADPIIPQGVIHFILKDMLGFFVLSYGQDVLVYSMSREEHPHHVRQVLVRFRYHHVYCSLDRSQFHRHSADFLGFVVTPKGVRLNKSIVSTVTGYPVPGSAKSLRNLIEFAFPYRHFVESFAAITEPLVRQLLSYRPFYWGREEQDALERLKRAFREAPLLHHPKPQNPFYLETGVTKTSLHASLIQVDDQSGKRVCCAFYSRNISPIEVEASPAEMKILPVRAAFMVWCRYLENTEEPIMILLNTEDLASLNDDRLTVLLPGHWVFFFSHFHFDVMERPEPKGGRPLPPAWKLLRRRALQHRAATRPGMLFAVGGPPRDQAPESGDGEETEDALHQDGPSGQNLQQEVLALIPADQILHSFLAHLSAAQIRAGLLHFFRGLLFWKNLLAVAALLVLLRSRRRLALPPAPTPDTARPPPRRSLRLLLDPSLPAGRAIAIATAVARPFAQMPPVTGADAIPAEEAAEPSLGAGRRQRDALLGLRAAPGFWQMLCEFLALGVAPREGTRPRPRPRPRPHRRLEPHVVDEEGVVSREALQDDLQRYRQCGLHDGLQDTSQDERESDERGAPGALGPRRRLPTHADAHRLLYSRGARELAAGAPTRLPTTVRSQSTPSRAGAGAGPPREGATLGELPSEEADADLD
ncbi:retrotransposon-like protein 1 [Physeter macrocephalus]|uniref:Retrotransposon-like protein 1 n=1 Tax=Physeter macrocephalus TaxID=9755 RepID=A0A2Y9EZ29_PHYMC|nr:retrotransposon-like protein 1 [Physeter catodon]|eukprot:XP_007111245.2 retrotransposon-like protein 1 [Physeter catodon]